MLAAFATTRGSTQLARARIVFALLEVLAFCFHKTDGIGLVRDLAPAVDDICHIIKC